MNHSPHTPHLTAANLDKAKDPVCGMSVSVATAKHRLEHSGETYFFCGPRCLEKFSAEPDRYVHSTAAAQAPPAPLPPTAEGTRYTCPMHPEIVQKGPGTCPICGMALEPQVATLDDAPNDELASMVRRFWISVPLSVVVLVLGMSDVIPGMPVQHFFGRWLA